ncbi:glycerophosphodiester phosphodiesterase-like protein [Thermochaetoides thermophila DSM 1495]|uniref:Glycerophosphodiester phosphodiesterase-like protein n=1 Tax=Chaetomium thermophilum (strain DSM 1495 / CBS 144.50 / IMI 039719) TaxID=759272 RepID=G0SDR0_CHATD|nr:glycerophosphodiester phosphodiesterase-like protein [Thermochaetoides thermophila DSM 1495]EGS18661.1 glycerophosphodiester phosphodiesterase-like protein [Thermochaetoides thermophila DSM 1495]
MTADEHTPLLADGMQPSAVAETDVDVSVVPKSNTNAGSILVTRLRSRPRGQPPQNIGHRGYKAAFPENTMASFRGALAAGADAIETDVHLSKDGVVVLSHDPTLKRCFGVDRRIADCYWEYLATLRTLREPHEPMPRLVELLGWLAEEGREGVWLLLDIKPDDDPTAIIPAIAEAIDSVPPAKGHPWSERVVLGGWNETWLRLLAEHLPGYPLAFISFSLLHAQRFLKPDFPYPVHFNLFQPALLGPVGCRFRRSAVRAGRLVFAWTVNEPLWMDWCACQPENAAISGVVTDEVTKLGEVLKGPKCGAGGDDDGNECDDEAEQVVVRKMREEYGLGQKIRLYAKAVLLQTAAAVLSVVLWRWLNKRGTRKMKGQRGEVKIT